MTFSVIVPAHNEEKFIQACLKSIASARNEITDPVEVIVALNRCTDATEELAIKFGAKIVREDEKNLSKIRNTGAKAATGEVIATIDADSQMSPNTLSEIKRLLSSGKFIGGGTRIKPERLSLGIVMSSLVIFAFAVFRRIPSAGLFWCYRHDFEVIGGFDESLVSIEDLDFAQRLKSHGAVHGKRFGTLWKCHIITSCRKFDHFGDWYFFKNPAIVRGLFRGTNRELADKFYYEFKRR